MTRRILMLVVIAGCGAAEKPAPVGPSLEVDTKAVEASIRTDVAAQYEALADFDVDAWATHLAPDAIVVGSGPEEVWVGREAAGAALHAHLDPAREAGASATTTSGGVHVGVAPDGLAAWTADEMTLTVNSNGQQLDVPFRITEVLGQRDGAWQVIAAEMSVGVPPALALERAESGDWPELAAMPAGIGGGAGDVYSKAARDLGRLDDLIASFSERDDALVFTATPDEPAIGPAAIKAQVFDPLKAGAATIRKIGEPRVALAPGGHVGWVLANVEVTTTSAGKPLGQPLRAMLVYVLESGSWELVQLHLSNGVPDA
jgi:ketosteroid isomerase-like protein